MNLPIWMPYALCGAGLVGLGLYGLLARPQLLRRILAFNIMGAGIFLLFGALARRGAVVGAIVDADPVPQAMIITGIVVAISATALALGLIVAHARAGGGEGLPGDTPGVGERDEPGADEAADDSGSADRDGRRDEREGTRR